MFEKIIIFYLLIVHSCVRQILYVNLHLLRPFGRYPKQCICYQSIDYCTAEDISSFPACPGKINALQRISLHFLPAQAKLLHCRVYLFISCLPRPNYCTAEDISSFPACSGGTKSSQATNGDERQNRHRHILPSIWIICRYWQIHICWLRAFSECNSYVDQYKLNPNIQYTNLFQSKNIYSENLSAKDIEIYYSALVLIIFKFF